MVLLVENVVYMQDVFFINKNSDVLKLYPIKIVNSSEKTFVVQIIRKTNVANNVRFANLYSSDKQTIYDGYLNIFLTIFVTTLTHISYVTISHNI